MLEVHRHSTLEFCSTTAIFIEDSKDDHEKRNEPHKLDFLQNRPQATVVAPYSLRPRPGAPVSMPLHWDEVKSGLRTRNFTIHNAIARIKQEGDLFKPLLGKSADLNKALKKLASL